MYAIRSYYDWHYWACHYSLFPDAEREKTPTLRLWRNVKPESVIQQCKNPKQLYKTLTQMPRMAINSLFFLFSSKENSFFFSIHVITSYSIHYTKLYDLNEYAVRNAFAVDMAMGGSSNTVLHMLAIVITSYSIHYTKLYDNPSMTIRCWTFALIVILMVCLSRVKRRFWQYLRGYLQPS